ncbi:hypothetical protein SANA_29310 [Gottschalkiaceae bacterium SANA]|nr:hypothetical protein SANA_29310 [Gottschalkiaceae bacterium SANA]
MNETMQRFGDFLKRFLIVLFGGSVGIGLIGGSAITVLIGVVKSMGYFPEIVVRVGFWELAQSWIMPVTGIVGALLLVSGLCCLRKAFAQL